MFFSLDFSLCEWRIMGGIKIGDHSLHKKDPTTETPTYTGRASVKIILIRVLFVLFMDVTC